MSRKKVVLPEGYLDIIEDAAYTLECAVGECYPYLTAKDKKKFRALAEKVYKAVQKLEDERAEDS